MKRMIAVCAVIAVYVILPRFTHANDEFAFVNVRVFDGETVIPEANVVVSDGRIAAFGENVEVPETAHVVDGKGKTLLPGFIDCHTHTYQPEHLRQAIIFGVTTELDMLTDPGLAASMRSEQKHGVHGQRADLFSVGFCATPPGGHGTEYGFSLPTINNPSHADEFVAARVKEGSDFIKIIYDDGRTWGFEFEKLSRETMGAVVKAAHQRKKLAVAHIGTREDVRDAIESGVDGLAHLFADRLPDDELLKLAADRGVFIVPTLTVLQSGVGIRTGSSLVDDSQLRPFLFPSQRRHLEVVARPRKVVLDKYAIACAAALAFHEAGVRILVGTDAPNPGVGHGVSMHRELELLVEAGLSTHAALAGATSSAAKAFGLSDRGRIAVTLRADLVLVEGDPMKDIRLTRKIVGVWKLGRPIDRETHRRKVQESVARRENVRNSPAPVGSESGLVSDFEHEEIRAEFGAGWMVSTDSLAGGKSTAKMKRVDGGAAGSKGSLRISGNVDDRASPRWAGVAFSPGKAPFSPANLSFKQAITFWAKGDGKRYTLMLFSQAGGPMPSIKTFVAGPNWEQWRFGFVDFDGSDGSDITGVLFGSSTENGSFDFQIDDVRLE